MERIGPTKAAITSSFAKPTAMSLAKLDSSTCEPADDEDEENEEDEDEDEDVMEDWRNCFIPPPREQSRWPAALTSPSQAINAADAWSSENPRATMD
jgi:hypothetical protein